MKEQRGAGSFCNEVKVNDILRLINVSSLLSENRVRA